MKKLICAAVIAGSMCAVAEEAVKAEASAVPAAAEAVKVAPKRPQLTPEKLARREQIKKEIAEKRAKTEAQMLEVVKKYVPEEEKAKALIKELEDVMRAAARRNMPHRPPRLAAPKPAETK